MAGLKSSPARSRVWSLADTYDFIACFLNKPPPATAYPTQAVLLPQQRQAYEVCHNSRKYNNDRPRLRRSAPRAQQARSFHDYFVTHLPSSSLHPDSRSSAGPHHKLPRSASIPHTPGTGAKPPAAAPPMIGTSRELTVVRIPLRSAKHHFGVSVSRGMRPYNEDTYQAGTIEVPAFAKRAPISLSRKTNGSDGPGATSADSASGDPQVFYFGVFDGHGGHECSDFLREKLHTYIEDTAATFELGSSLKTVKNKGKDYGGPSPIQGAESELSSKGQESLDKVAVKGKEEVESDLNRPVTKLDETGAVKQPPARPSMESEAPKPEESNMAKAVGLQKALVTEWKDTVGGYFRRFKPAHFALSAGSSESDAEMSIEAVLMYAFLKADLDFVTAQARKPDPDNSDAPLNQHDILGSPSRQRNKERIGGPARFIGGSTASIAMISTPTPTPFWHPASPSSLVVAHVGDTRILLCSTATGLAIPLTTNHHPSAPVEGNRLRRYAATFVTDSFGEERMSGLANTRAFGDMRSKRIGVSAEPEVRRVELAPAEYSFIVLISDGISGTLTDQEIVDVVKEAKTPEQGARDVVSFGTEVSKEGDNATCLVVRLGGWERRSEGGMGSLGTREVRDFRRKDAGDPRSRRT
ncbi:protein serine phosphatase 2C-1 [Coleophoma crateriformis]|uniref:Protein serine phosphatase 2C-1 n=1 Tax=Coleophoma crateriformis TaxID=565419 RepID=A0A3D8T9Q6_9HELO|nr:protein serine phosphatase 2C-1 [Coleophoma crateriformis]